VDERHEIEFGNLIKAFELALPDIKLHVPVLRAFLMLGREQGAQLKESTKANDEAQGTAG
jgi:hypothetical protein